MEPSTENQKSTTLPTSRGSARSRLLFACSVYFFGDLLTTYIGLQVGLQEANPLATPIIDSEGWLLAVSVKFILTATVLLHGWLSDKEWVAQVYWVSMLVIGAAVTSVNAVTTLFAVFLY